MFAIVICGAYIAGTGTDFDTATTVFKSEVAGLKCERAEVIGEACHKAVDVARPVTWFQQDAAQVKSDAGLMPWTIGAVSVAEAMPFTKLKPAI